MRRSTRCSQHGARQGGAFLRIGACTQFIQQMTRVSGLGASEDAHNVGDMPGEGGKGLLDGLFIADIRKDIVEQTEL